MPLILPGNVASATAGAYEVANSCRFDQASSDYLSKTLGTATNDKIWTFSCWVKRSTDATNAQQHMFFGSGGNTDDNWFQIRFESDYITFSGYSTIWLKTNRLFRDQSAFYHVVAQADSTQGTASNRLKLYINGIEETSFQTDGRSSTSGDQTWGINKNVNHCVGSESGGGSSMDGYMSEVVFIDGQALTPTSFGEFDEDSPTIWKPKDVSGLTFGTNGFYLDFEDSADLGADVSGNSNDFTVNNLTSVDQTTDTPTNNFCTMNPITMSSLAALAEGNLKVLAASASDNGNTQITFAPQVGKWYFECKLTIDSATYPRIGIAPIESVGRLLNANDGLIGVITGSAAQYANGDKYISGAQTADYGESYSTGDIMGIALDFDNGAFYTSKNNAWQGSSDPESGASKTNALFTWTAGAEEYIAGVTTYSTSSAAEMNFGGCQSFTISSGNADADGYGNFEYAPPSGYYALCTKNLAEYG